MTKENRLYVIYAGVQGIRSEDIEDYIHRISTRIVPTEGETIIIPVQSPDTRIECVNPIYITDADLILEHTELMKELNENLRNQVEQLKEENNG